MLMLFAYMAGGEGGGGGLEVLKCCQRGSEFLILALCVYGVGEGGVRFSISPSVKKITDPLLLIND